MSKHRQILQLALLVAVATASGCTIGGTNETPVSRGVFTPPAATETVSPKAPAGTRRVLILHTNDEHSHLLGFAPTSLYPFLPETDGSVTSLTVATMATKIATGADTETVGGLVRRQYLINQLRASSPDPVLTLEAGDVMMGTIFHLAEAQAAPDLLSLAFLGYDFMTLGNHEFDFGPDVLAAAITTAQKASLGGAVPIIASNIHFGDVKTHVGSAPLNPGEALRALYGDGNSSAPIMPYATKVLANGLKVGLVGALGYDAALVAAGKPPIVFSVPSDGAACTTSATCTPPSSCELGHCVNPLDSAGHIAALASDLQPVVDLLRQQEKVDLVIAITHLGMLEDTALAAQSQGIDVIIGGHSHEKIPPTRVGHTTIVQAGSYGRQLGQLLVTVAPNGTVFYDDTASQLTDIDSTLDAAIYAGTDLTAVPSVLSTAFTRAVALTKALIGPVLGGINQTLTALGGFNALTPIVASDHTIVGELAKQDANLSQLVTDADLAIVAGGSCFADANPIVAVQANGVIRESLHFGVPLLGGRPSASVADIFQVLPLGASPFSFGPSPQPGFPLLMFEIAAAGMYAGLDVGVTEGLLSDSFFLTYAGARVTYDRTLPAFDPTDADHTGRVTKIELGTDPDYAWKIYDHSRSPVWAARWRAADGTTPISPLVQQVTIITNLYIAGFLDAFGLQPLTSGGTPMSLTDAVLCQTGLPKSCPSTAPIMPCTTPALSGAAPELKEWEALLQYLTLLQAGPGHGFAPSQYAGNTPEIPRVIDATPR